MLPVLSLGGEGGGEREGPHRDMKRGRQKGRERNKRRGGEGREKRDEREDRDGPGKREMEGEMKARNSLLTLHGNTSWICPFLSVLHFLWPLLSYNPTAGDGIHLAL